MWSTFFRTKMLRLISCAAVNIAVGLASEASDRNLTAEPIRLGTPSIQNSEASVWA